MAHFGGGGTLPQSASEPHRRSIARPHPNSPGRLSALGSGSGFGRRTNPETYPPTSEPEIQPPADRAYGSAQSHPLYDICRCHLGELSSLPSLPLSPAEGTTLSAPHSQTISPASVHSKGTRYRSGAYVWCSAPRAYLHWCPVGIEEGGHTCGSVTIRRVKWRGCPGMGSLHIL